MDLDKIELPTRIEETLYTTMCIDSRWASDIGKIRTTTVNYETLYDDHDHESYVLLHTEKIAYDLPRLKFDPKTKMIEKLEKMKEKELAEHHVRMKGYQDRIDQLLAIEYQPENEE